MTKCIGVACILTFFTLTWTDPGRGSHRGRRDPAFETALCAPYWAYDSPPICKCNILLWSLNCFAKLHYGPFSFLFASEPFIRSDRWEIAWSRSSVLHTVIWVTLNIPGSSLTTVVVSTSGKGIVLSLRCALVEGCVSPVLSFSLKTFAVKFTLLKKFSLRYLGAYGLIPHL